MCACVRGGGLWRHRVLASKWILSFSGKSEGKYNNLSLWLIIARGGCWLSPSVVSSARWDIKARKFNYVVFVKWIMRRKGPHCFSPVPVLSIPDETPRVRRSGMLCVCMLTTSSKLTLAPLRMSSCTISRFPSSAATIRGVCPFWEEKNRREETTQVQTLT